MRTKWIPCMIFAGALAVPLSSVIAGTAAQETKRTDEKPKVFAVGSTVPESLALPDFAADMTSFKDLRGKVTIVHFWSDRCPAERHANPVFMEMEKRFADNKDVVMIGIAANQNELGAVPAKDADRSKTYPNLRKKMKEVGYKHKMLVDHGNKVSTLFGARSTPHCFVIDKKGVIQYAGALDDDPRGSKGKEATNYLVDATAAILKGEAPKVTSTKPYG
ncbi:MAG: thiol-disulfide isomerase/thioredoxin [Planctomycetota bacterium]|jgi:thiol-disulfide isomerase/thioredoxin